MEILRTTSGSLSEPEKKGKTMTDTTNTEATQVAEFKMNKSEQEAKEVFDLMLVEGIDKPTAARYAVTTLPKTRTKFVEFLSDGVLTKRNGKIIEKGAA